MTTGTNTKYFRMINGARRHRHPRGWSRLMTGLTYIRGSNVTRAFARRCIAIVTTDATANNLCMIHISVCYRNPRRAIVMARITLVTCRDVTG